MKIKRNNDNLNNYFYSYFNYIFFIIFYKNFINLLIY